jgi:hypothetical protein
MEAETTEALGAGESTARSFGWYVALTQLPGVPLRVRAACSETVLEGLRRLPVASRRQHVWHSVHPAQELATAEEDFDVPLAEPGLEGAPAPI